MKTTKIWKKFPIVFDVTNKFKKKLIDLKKKLWPSHNI